MSQAGGPARRLGRGPSASLFAQVLALVLLSVIAAQALNLWIVFHSQMNPPDFYRMGEVAAAFQGKTPLATSDGRPLVRRLLRAGDAPREPQQRIERFLSDDLALRLNAPPQAVRVRMLLDQRSVTRQTVGVVRRLLGVRGLHHGDSHFIPGPFEAGVLQPDGRWLVVEPEGRPFLTGWQLNILLWFTLTCVALAPVVWLFARRLSSPMSTLAEAAERLGRDPEAPPLRVTGPAEMQTVTTAFNEMQDRLRRYVQDRTAMIGAVAHDLRTPLTRLRFRVESVPEPLRSKMTADMEQMDAMIAATMAFARDVTKTGERSRLELSSLVQSVADEMADTGADVSAETKGPVVIEGDPIALRRLVANLLDNAVKFGARARARVYTEPGAAVIEVDDDGPGLGIADREKVFEPFFRGEPSRNRATGGAGLGLAVVRAVARAHGGDAALENLPGGGLRARARLPI